MPGTFAVPDGYPPGPAVVVVQEWWGLNGQIEMVTQRFAALGFAAVAPDLYRGKVATEPDSVLALFEDSAAWSLPIVRATIAERLMRRFAASGTGPDLARCARLLALAPGPDHIKSVMAGFEAAYAGRSLARLRSLCKVPVP